MSKSSDMEEVKRKKIKAFSRSTFIFWGVKYQQYYKTVNML